MSPIRKGNLTLTYHHVDSDALAARRSRTIAPPPPSQHADTEPDLAGELSALERARLESLDAVTSATSGQRPTVPARGKRGGL